MSSVESILTASVAALGSPDALARLRTISAFAECKSPRAAYTTQIHSARGGRVWFQQTFANREPFRIIINPAGAWATNVVTGETSTLDAPTISMIRGHEFQMLPLTLADRFTNFEVADEIELNGTRCLSLRARDDLGAPCALYFRTADSRWAGMLLANSQRENENVRVTVNGWTCVSDVWLPSRVTATDSSGDYFLDFTTITLNDVSEEIFQNPTQASQSLKTLA